VFYGREAVDPETPSQKMCRELDRTKEINGALGDVSRQACKNGAAECQFYRTCSYQAQQRLTPRVWIVAHNRLFRERPSFIPQPDFLWIDEQFWGASLNGLEEPKLVMTDDLEEVREVMEGKKSRKVDSSATADLMAASQRMARILREEMSGRIRKAVLDNFDAEELRIAYRLEWRRKIELDIKPDMPLATVAALCMQVADHNQQVKLLTEFWDLMLRTKIGEFNRSPFLDLQKSISPDKGHKGRKVGNQPAGDGVYLAWSDGIHPSWYAPAANTDATMSEKIVRRFYHHIATNHFFNDDPAPHTYIRQITDKRMSKINLVPNKHANPDQRRTQQNNLKRVLRLIAVKARELWPGKLLVICQKDLEKALIDTGKVPQNVELQHFKNHAGQNDWRDVPGLAVIGRTEPGVREVERIARALFGADIAEIEPNDKGAPRWPLADGHIRLRDGTSVIVKSSHHPDPHVDEMWQQICVAELMQAIGRGRGDDRTEDDPLQVIILTNVPLPLTVDETLTWKEIQPSLAQIMWASGAVPVGYRDMAAAYPDLFDSAEAARKAIKRENPGQTPIKIGYLINVCPGFQSISYRRPGSRGPAGRLLYDPARIEPTAWLAEHLGATVTTEPVRRARGGVPMVEAVVDGEVRRVIDFNAAGPT
jgi:putative DNA primase/helicase